MQTGQVLLCGTAVPVCIVTGFEGWPVANSQIFLGNKIMLLWKKVKDRKAPLGLTFLTPNQTIRHRVPKAYCKFPPEVSDVCNISQEPWNFLGKGKLCLQGKNAVHGGLSQCTWQCRTIAAWARVKPRVIHPFWTCSEIPGIWYHQINFFFSMDLCGFFAQPFPTGYQAGAVAAQFPHHLAWKAFWELLFS